MRKTKTLASLCLLLCICTSAILTSCQYAHYKIPKNEKFNYVESDWTTTFLDNFDGDSVNLNNWKIDTMPSDDPNKNGIRRAAYYVDDAETVFVKDGNLTLRTAYRDGKLGKGWYTAWLDTSVKKGQNETVVNPNYKGLSQKQGYFEIKCQVPPSKGIWSAFWLMPDEGVAFSENDIQNTASDGLEIDIMESPYFASGKGACTHVLHADGYDEKLKSSKSKTYTVPNMYTEMHTYAMEWTADKYIFYIDGYKTWETQYDYNGTTMGTSDVLQYMILSVEVGGSNENGVLYPGKDKDKNGNFIDHWSGDAQKNDFSKNYDFIIDYVKVMQRK